MLGRTRMLVGLLVLGAACADPADPTMADTPTGPAAETDPTAEAERVWQAFAARVEAATVIRLFYMDPTRAAPRESVPAMLTVHRDGRASRYLGTACREILAAETIRGACSRPGDSGYAAQAGYAPVPAGEQTAALRLFLEYFSSIPHQEWVHFSPDSKPALAPVNVWLQPTDSQAVHLGFADGELVRARIDGAGLDRFVFDIYKVEFDPEIPPDFFELTANPVTADVQQTYETWAAWRAAHEGRQGIRTRMEDVEPTPLAPDPTQLLIELAKER